MKQCAYCGRENEDEATCCLECGTGEFKALLAAPENRDLIALVLVANDVENRLWSAGEVAEVQRALAQNYNPVPTPEDLFRCFGESTVKDAFNVLAQERRAYLEEMAPIEAVPVPNNVCHLCGQQGRMQLIPFGLSKTLSSRTDWSGTAASVALAAITLPVFGHSVMHGPGQEEVANVVKLNFQLCHDCGKQRKGFFGGIKLRSDDYSRHPRWKCAFEAGFRKLLHAEQLAQYTWRRY